MSGNGRDAKGHFLPGTSGNPYGRPPAGRTMTDIVKDFLDEIPEGSETARKRLLIDRLYRFALKGKISAARLLLAYHSGLPRQALDITAHPAVDDETRAYFKLLEKHPRLAREYQKLLTAEQESEHDEG